MRGLLWKLRVAPLSPLIGELPFGGGPTFLALLAHPDLGLAVFADAGLMNSRTLAYPRSDRGWPMGPGLCASASLLAARPAGTMGEACRRSRTC